jgi:hypothetical protein
MEGDEKPKAQTTPEDGRKTLMWMGLIVLAFIAGAVVSMAGFNPVHPPAKEAAPAQTSPSR